jgi:hypothetical protein
VSQCCDKCSHVVTNPSPIPSPSFLVHVADVVKCKEQVMPHNSHGEGGLKLRKMSKEGRLLFVWQPAQQEGQI